WVDAEEEADDGTDGDAQRGDPALHGSGEAGELAQRQCAAEADGDADDAADQALNDALHHELLEDVGLGGADGAPDADLLGALGDADELDVHDDDAAHHGGDGTDHDEDGEEGGADALPEGDVAVGRADEEVVVGAGLVVTSRAKCAAGVVLRGGERALAVFGFGLNGEAAVAAAHLEIGAQGDDDEVVLVLAEDAADLLEGSDDGELLGIGANGVAQRVFGGEELACDAGADQADVSGVLILDVGEVAAEFDGAGVDATHGGGEAVDAGVIEFVVGVAESGGAGHGAADGFAMRAGCGHGVHVLGIEVAVSQGFGEEVEIGNGERGARDPEDVGAEVGDLLLDVEVGALDKGHDGDERGHAHDETEHRQRGAELVRADGVDGQYDVVGELDHVRNLHGTIPATRQLGRRWRSPPLALSAAGALRRWRS